KVDISDLLEFIFPPALQHPLSTGRLYAFSMYGPLDENSRLRSGHRGEHVVNTWELDAMCLQFEKEDTLQVYISASRPLCILNEAQKEDVIAQADSHLKNAKGRGYRKQITQQEVIELFSDLARDTDGRLSFHEMQQQVMRYRKNQISRFKVIFPDITSGKRRSKQTVAEGGAGKDCCGVRPTTLTSRSVRCRGGKLRADVSPPEMFIKDVGYTPAELVKHTNELLSTRAYKICDISDGNNPGLTENVRLIREDSPLPQGQALWDPYSCLRGMHLGGHVKSARSTTTSNRRA
ncbi:unnamed protein product, partial [Choristocarpus tenellus]